MEDGYGTDRTKEYISEAENLLGATLSGDSKSRGFSCNSRLNAPWAEPNDCVKVMGRK